MAIDVEDVATDADLEAYTLGKSNLQDLLPGEWLDDAAGEKLATIARQRALDFVLSKLANRRPPIRENDLTDLSELKTVVCYGALEILYRGAITHDESPNAGRAKAFGQMFRSELDALQPTVREGVTASSLSFRIHRG